MKRRRLLGKQPPPPCYCEDSRLADHTAVRAAERAAESHTAAAVMTLPEAASPEPEMAGVERVDGTADSAPRWHLLGKYRTVQALVSAVVRDKSDEQLQSLSVTVLLQDILHNPAAKHFGRTFAREGSIYKRYDDCSAERTQPPTAAFYEHAQACFPAGDNRRRMRPEDLFAHFPQHGPSHCPYKARHSSCLFEAFQSADVTMGRMPV